MEEKTADKIEPVKLEGISLKSMSLEQKQQATQLYHQLGLEPVVQKALKEFSSSLSGMDRVLDKIFGPYDVKGRAEAVARLTTLITHNSLSEEHQKRVAKLEQQITSLEVERDQFKADYSNLVRKVADVVGGDYEKFKANYYELVDKFAEVERLRSQIEALNKERAQLVKMVTKILEGDREELGNNYHKLVEKIIEGEHSTPQQATLDKEKAQFTQSYESQIAHRDSKIEGLELEKTALTAEIERLKSNYEELRTAITTVDETIQYDELSEKLGQKLSASLLEDSKLAETGLDGVERSIEFKKYLRVAIVKGAEEAIRLAKETLRKMMKNGTTTEGVDVTIYIQNEVLSGAVSNLKGRRFSDLLNETPDQLGWSDSTFVKLRNVNVRKADGSQVKLPTAYIMKSTVHIAALADSNAARGVGAEDGPKSFPFVPKSPVLMELPMVDYMVIGNAHLASGQNIWDVLNETPRFIPLTNVSIRKLRDNTEFTAPFVAANKEKISLFQQPEIAPDNSELMRASFRKLLEARLGYFN